jgi:hypothetical protein
MSYSLGAGTDVLGWQSPTNRELALLAAMVTPLAIVGMVVAQIPLDAYANADPQAFVARSLQIATHWLELDELGQPVLKDPPLRYAPFVLVYTLVTPSNALAPYIASTIATLTLFVAVPLTAWMSARILAAPRVGLATVAALVVGWLDVLVSWPDTVAAWQYHVALPWAFAVLVSAHWTLQSAGWTQRYRRAAVTGALVGVLGLTQVLFAAIAAMIVTVAFLAARRPRSLAVAGLSGLPFSAYYLLVAPAREQVIGSIGGRGSTESLLPVSVEEFVLGAAIVAVIVAWYCTRRWNQDRDSQHVLGAGALVAGGVWMFAIFLRGVYLTLFVPVLAYPLVAAAAADIVSRLVEPRRGQPLARLHATDEGRSTMPLIERLSWRAFAFVLVVFTLVLTVILLVRIPPQYPGVG